MDTAGGDLGITGHLPMTSVTFDVKVDVAAIARWIVVLIIFLH